jgi:hypothetical protein
MDQRVAGRATPDDIERLAVVVVMSMRFCRCIANLADGWADKPTIADSIPNGHARRSFLRVWFWARRQSVRQRVFFPRLYPMRLLRPLAIIRAILVNTVRTMCSGIRLRAINALIEVPIRHHRMTVERPKRLRVAATDAHFLAHRARSSNMGSQVINGT